MPTTLMVAPAGAGSHPDCPLQGPVFTANKEVQAVHLLLLLLLLQVSLLVCCGDHQGPLSTCHALCNLALQIFL